MKNISTNQTPSMKRDKIQVWTISFNHIQTAIKILSNHNILNYHMEKCGLALSPHCDYCTDTMKEIDGNWDIKCLETSCHILCKCKYYSTQRASLYYDFTTDIDEIFHNNMTYNIVKMAKFFHSIKYFKDQLNSIRISYTRTDTEEKLKGKHLKKVMTIT